MIRWLVFLVFAAFFCAGANADSTWIAAVGNSRIQQEGEWNESRFRYAEAASLQTGEDGAALELEFIGTGIAIRLGGHNVPAYGTPNLGKLTVFVDGKKTKEFHPRDSPREIVLARKLPPGSHRLRLVHQAKGGNTGCRVEGFRSWSQPVGELQFTVTGDASSFLVDARATVSGGASRRSLIRNWMTGQCALTGLNPDPPRNSLKLEAAGWKTVEIDDIKIDAGDATRLPPIHLEREESTVIRGFRFPALNRPAIRKPGDSFSARFLAYRATIDEITLTRRTGPAVISRKLEFEEDESRAFYYDREVVAKLPKDMPPGLYDLSVRISRGRHTSFSKSPRSVNVVKDFPADPVFVTFGHLDTSAQYQAEYLGRIAEMANLIGADMVLNSNAVNPAYISGALSRLEVPYLVNFGNHQFFGHEQWYGDPVNRVDFGSDISILNYGHPWHHGIELADALLSQRPDAKIKIINAFEQNAPLEFLDRHRVRMIHDAHGTGERVMDMGATPTRRIGKTNAISFRVIRFRGGRVEKCTYNGHETKPIPFERDEESPLSASFSAKEGESGRIKTATIVNRFLDPLPGGRLVFWMRAGKYRVDNGQIESQIASDDGDTAIVTVRVDIPADNSIDVTVHPE